MLKVNTEKVLNAYLEAKKAAEAKIFEQIEIDISKANEILAKYYIADRKIAEDISVMIKGQALKTIDYAALPYAEIIYEEADADFLGYLQVLDDKNIGEKTVVETVETTETTMSKATLSTRPATGIFGNFFKKRDA